MKLIKKLEVHRCLHRVQVENKSLHRVLLSNQNFNQFCCSSCIIYHYTIIYHSGQSHCRNVQCSRNIQFQGNLAPQPTFFQTYQRTKIIKMGWEWSNMKNCLMRFPRPFRSIMKAIVREISSLRVIWLHKQGFLDPPVLKFQK